MCFLDMALKSPNPVNPKARAVLVTLAGETEQARATEATVECGFLKCDLEEPFGLFGDHNLSGEDPLFDLEKVVRRRL